MRGLRWILVVMVLGVFVGGRVIADDVASKPSALTPLEVLADALDAVETGDFERYVDHLTPNEQRLQAGYGLYIVVALTESQGRDAFQPELILLTQALRDVAIRHLQAPEGKPGAAPGETPEMLVRKLLSSLFVQPVGLTRAGAPHHTPGFEQICLKASGLLKEPRQFLIDALQELSVATQVSGAELDRPVESVDLSAHARLLKEAEWILYTRGDRALAVQKFATANNPPAADAAAPKPAPPAPNDDGPKPMHLEFRKIDADWKIERLLPISAMQSELNITPHTTQAVPYPAEW